MTSVTKTYALPDSRATHALGMTFGRMAQAGDFIALYGDLGAGKTTFARGFVEGFLGAPHETPSPTFTLVQRYTQPDAIVNTQAGLDLFHFDLYRLNDPEEIWELGWEDIGAGLALVEWPDRAGDYLPKDRLDIRFLFEGEGRMVHAYSSQASLWKDRLDGA
jgi:tRNA threonylcarbamoyladenosine biosynthesis protein TsaE